MKRLLSRLLIPLIFILLLNSKTVQSQIYPFNNYSVRQGLINSNVYAMVQDQAGFIWLGTENGLSRFDGLKFKNYTLDQLGIKSYISSLLILENGEVMFGSGSDGLYIFNPLTEKVRLFSLIPIIRSNSLIVKDSILISLHENKNFNFLSIKTGKQLFDDNVFIANTDIKAISMAMLKNRMVVFGRTNGIYFLNENRIEKLIVEGLPDCPIYSISEINNILYLGSENIIYRLNNFKLIDSIRIDTGYSIEVRNIEIDNQEKLWFNDWGQKDIFVYNNTNIINVSEKIGITSGSITKILKDSSGTIFASCIGKGFFIFSNNHFLIFPETSILTTNCIHKLIKLSNNGLLLGTNNGLKYFNINNYYHYNLSPFIENKYYIRDLLMLDKNHCFVAIIDSRFARSFSQNFYYNFDNLNIKFIHCSSIFNDNGRIFIGNWDNRILIFNKINLNIIDTIESIFKEEVRINCMYNDSYNNFWIGSQKGLCVINKEGEKYFPTGTFQNEDIRQIEKFEQNQVMIVTNSGYYILETNDNTESVNLVNKNIILGTNCVSHTGKNEFLVGTSYGLYLIKDNQKNLMTIQDGILSENINDIYFEKESSTAWVGTAEGLMQVDLNLLRKGTKSPLEIRQIILVRDGKQKIPENSNVFEYGASEFHLKFYAFHYNNPGRIRYQYKSDDGNWINAPSNEIQFASLSPGTHAISIRAGLAEEAWGPTRSVSITILPPFYQTWWFYMAEIILFAVGISLAVRERLRHVRKKQEAEIQIKQKIVVLQQKALANNLNPHFVFNSLNAIQHFINCKSGAEANIYLAKFARLMRMHLNMAEDSKIILQSDIQRLEFYLSLEQLRFDKKLKWEINIDPLLNPVELEIPNMVIQPFIENSIWHGIMPASYAGYVCLDIRAGINESIIITITDNGVGMHYKRNAGIINQNSRGTRLIKERLLLLDPDNKTPLTFNELDPGTSVIIVLTSKMYRKLVSEEPFMG